MCLFKLQNIKVNDILHIEHLEIPEKTVTCIMGPSGIGKSTMLRLFNNLLSPDDGDVLYKGQSLGKVDPIQLRRSVVMVPQTPVIFEGTVQDNLLIGCEFSEKELPTKRDMENILQMFRLEKELSDDARHLSGGEKQRVALARALLMEPKVYLLDEPSSALDEETGHIVIQNIARHVKGNAQTLIMITHDKELASKISENTIDMASFRKEKSYE